MRGRGFWSVAPSSRPTARLATHAALGCAAVAGFAPVPLFPQDPRPEIEGRWAGAVSVMGSELPFSVTFTTEDGELGARIDIPSQGVKDLELSRVSWEAPTVHFELDAPIGVAVWEGDRAGEVVEGTFEQGGVRGSFTMTRAIASEGDAAEGAPGGEPPPYREEDIVFDSGEVSLEGTLTLPPTPGPHPAAVLITGSGPQNRDEELLGFPIFRVIADHLTREGIAVLRYDDRGVGGSTGSVSASTTADFADDALAAVARLAEHPAIASDRIGLLGHSEGGVVAPLAASRSDAVAFAVLLAGTSVPGAEIVIEQSAAIARERGAPEEDVDRQADFQRRL
ncbi:MAG: alpha/beta hydrolase, partial [Gemmatimonadota bacterium]|nr:alpha/beta hydrolase [Gemmatimonadota bacterium]